MCFDFLYNSLTEIFLAVRKIERDMIISIHIGKGRGIPLLFLDHGIRRGSGVSVTPWPLFTPGKDPLPIVQEAGWTPGPIWTGAENLATTGIRSPGQTYISLL